MDVSSSLTVISITTCSPIGMSIPIAGSSITTAMPVPVFTGVQAPEPLIFDTLTSSRSAAEAFRSSKIRTSYSGAVWGVDGTVIR